MDERFDIEGDERDFDAHMENLFTWWEVAELAEARQAWDEQEEAYAEDQEMPLGFETNSSI